MSKFAKNFGYSSLAYIILSCFWYFLLINFHTFRSRLIFASPDYAWLDSLWIWAGKVIVHTVGSAAIFFFLGRKLNLLGKHWLNLLSVSGSFVFSAFLSVIFSIVIPVDVLIIFALPFAVLLMYIGYALSYIIGFRDDVVFFFAVFIATIFSSIVIWLGMAHKARQTNKEKESDVRRSECE